MADYEKPTWPALVVAYPDSDVSPLEPGLVWVHDEKTGTTTVEEGERFYYGPPKA